MSEQAINARTGETLLEYGPRDVICLVARRFLGDDDKKWLAREMRRAFPNNRILVVPELTSLCKATPEIIEDGAAT